MTPLPDSVARWARLVERQPANELARFSLGKAWFDAGNFSAAKEHLALALAKKPDWMVVQILLGNATPPSATPRAPAPPSTTPSNSPSPKTTKAPKPNSNNSSPT